MGLPYEGMKLIDANAEDVSSGVIMEGAGLNHDDWIVLIAAEEPRKSRHNLKTLHLCLMNLKKP